MANTRAGGDYQFSVVEKEQADTYLLIMKNVSAFSQLDCHLPTPPSLPPKKQISTLAEKMHNFCRSPSAPRPRLWEFLLGEHLKNMINFKCTIKAAILCIGITFSAVNEIKF